MNLAQIVANNRHNILSNTKKNGRMISLIDDKIKTLESTNLQEIKWVGESTIKKLLENWISSKDELIEIGEDGIKKLSLNFLSERALLKFIKALN